AGIRGSLATNGTDRDRTPARRAGAKGTVTNLHRCPPVGQEESRRTRRLDAGSHQRRPWPRRRSPPRVVADTPWHPAHGLLGHQKRVWQRFATNWAIRFSGLQAGKGELEILWL